MRGRRTRVICINGKGKPRDKHPRKTTMQLMDERENWKEKEWKKVKGEREENMKRTGFEIYVENK